MNLESQLYGLVSDNLFEMSSAFGYPIRKELALDSFLNAFRDRGYYVDCFKDEDSPNNEDLFDISYDFFEKGSRNMSIQGFSSERILKGKNISPKASVASLYDSVQNFYESLFFDISQNFRGFSDEYYSLVRDESYYTISYLDARLEAYINKYQEFALMPFLMKPADLKSPKIFYNALENFDFDIYSEAINREQNGIIPVEDISPIQIYEQGIREFSCVDECPSRDSLEGYFLGLYLSSLADQKGYPTIYGDNLVEGFMLDGLYAFRHGRALWGLD
ncbi:MAG: hypothetical protein ABEI74_01720 [Candidatus Pacearchaeota archaeon]